MPFDVDPRFRTTAQQARDRRRRRSTLRICAVALVLGAFAGLLWGIAGWYRGTGGNVAVMAENAEGADEEAFALVQSGENARSSIDVERVNSFIDLRRDPMILHFAGTKSDLSKNLPAPTGFAQGRLMRNGPDAVLALKDRLFVAERRLVTTLPSSRDDFALFKAQRSQGLRAVRQTPMAAPATQGQVVAVEEESSWGTLIGPAQEAATAAVYVETQIENTTSTALTLRESQRKQLYKDEIIVLQAPRDLANVLMSGGLSMSEAAGIARAASQKLTLLSPLATGSVVALRMRPGGRSGQLMQMSVYSPQGYLASLAQVGAGRFEPAADPWIDADLLSRSGKVRQEAGKPGEVRLLDALYSAAIRNGMSTSIVGELIVLMSQRFDLDRFVADGDEMVLLRAADPGPAGRGLGAVLYVGIHGPTQTMRCYVLASADDFSCFDFDAPSGGGVSLGGGFLVPVDGVKTSGFGPRHHPILNQVRNHNGVDWAAPTGTPVLAVAAGRVTRIGDGGGYGNVIYLDHGGGVETRYAHLNAFAKSLKKGAQVAAGEVIGFVGTTGRSTGPHLHFELHAGGKPVDPLTYGGSGEGRATQAVDALVNQIIRVESAGVATAKNPLSTATGLGQFIQSTWLRMMRDYRPDLVRKMSRAQLLALRTDPALSREMVRNLARENEAFLRARGHKITAGRLYLAHFLGPGGAHTALRANPEASVLSVMGAQVVNANPFLRGKSIADLRAWSDRKMRRKGKTPRASAPVRRIPPHALAYRAAVDAMLVEM
ncbi:M23 family metallopeptidase [Sulfitobacter sp. M57]|uniref:M23 family metallopeptidase n=1 Tax=unclassified Sulfitobacter TaxID=196795 RepID=UPI0023E0D94C|nr:MULTISPECIES: M23 family metallopeptidase [unclassified Sulfitobacter]MDF3416139.1 M23 family metallopeptidase [Sulfitobacter sp. KE5]MDF3423618.1 M23 family metallopeptidase [Sulfitobacter sp. KE43]MDF3434580.1 M23 family metallopeptidase [Sulfitobacter sp. KE42]MDF3460324.1 M23 family metallopeptidase [Sulfitobacter sp. S74]MDF3464118.1 M23 family metallopeptidase [Sulfitobacter sp. Ks18]